MLKSALMLTPVFAIVALAFWFMLPTKTPLIISDQPPVAQNTQLSDLSEKINNLETKVDTLESSSAALIQRISKLQSQNPGVKNAPPQTGKKSPVLFPINPGDNVDSTSWTNLTTGSITVNPADYPGYKNAYLIMNLSVYVGQGTAYAQLVNSQNGLAIIPSRVSTNSYQPVSLTSGPFQLPTGSNSYTVQMYTQVPGYPAQAGNSYLQITY